MKNANRKTYAFWIVLTELAGAAAGFASREGAELYQQTVLKPALSPPGWLFPAVWALLYLLMAISVSRVSLATDGMTRSRSLRLYLAQLAVNCLWPILFFNLQAFGTAFLWLVLLFALIVWMTLQFREINRTAGWLLLPYLLWVSFAGYLNCGVWMLNR